MRRSDASGEWIVRYKAKSETMNYSIGIDLGGTQIRAVRIDREGQIHAHQRIETAATSGPQVVIGRSSS
jgi:predicted NBD/HSP70 family sugar kinase